MTAGRSTKGRLLLATPPLGDPNFDRTVVLMLEHNEEGALGLVLNRPSTQDAIPGLRSWHDVATPPSLVFHGGPVETETLIGLARAADPIDSDGWAPLDGGLGTVDLEVEPEDIAPRFIGLRLFRGYSGWGGGQLDAELEAGAWIVLDAWEGDPFSPRPSELWRDVLRRQGGRLAWVAEVPDDLSAN